MYSQGFKFQYNLLVQIDDVRYSMILTLVLVLTIFNQGAYLSFKSIFHKALNLFYFDCEITFEYGKHYTVGEQLKPLLYTVYMMTYPRHTF